MRYLVFILSFTLAVYPLQDAYAKKKGNKGVTIPEEDIAYATYTNKKGKDTSLACWTNKKGKVTYGTYSTNTGKAKANKKDKKNQQVAKKKKKNAKGNKQATSKAKKKLASAKQVISDKKVLCTAALSGGGGGGGGGGNPVPPDPLQPLTGTLTEDHLNLLLERAAFGKGSNVANAIINAGLTSGLNAAVNSLTTRRAEDSSKMALMQDWVDGEILEDPGDDRQTDNDEDPDIDEELDGNGVANALTYHAYFTENPFFYKLAIQLLLPQFTVNNAWMLVQPGVNRAHDSYEQWYYYERLLFSDSDTADIRKMADELLNRRVMIEQYGNTSNTSSGLHHEYSTAMLSHILPAYTDSVGRPIHSQADVLELSKILTGLIVIELDGEMLPVFSAPNHVSGNKALFAGSGSSCSADRLEDYFDNCAFTGASLSRYYARKILQLYLTPDPPAALVSELASEIRLANYQLIGPIKKLFLSEVFYDAAYRNQVPKNPIEVMVSFHHALGIPLRTGEDANASNEGIRQYAERSGYHPERIPEGGYPVEMWASVQNAVTMRNLMERAFEDVEDNEVDEEGDPDHFYGLEGFDITNYLPAGEEVLSDAVVDAALATMGVPQSDFSQAARDELKYYLLHRRFEDLTEPFFPYNNVSQNENIAKGVGIHLVVGGSLPFLFK